MKRIITKTSNARHRTVLTPADTYIEGDFDMLCCDLSYACPGFALLRYHADIRQVELLGKSCVKKKYHSQDGNYPGEILDVICQEMDSYLGNPNLKLVVRESSFVSKYHATEMVYRVVGATECLLWQRLKMPYHEMSPASIKKIVGGYGNASKEEVADGLEPYIGYWTYRSNDESDAAAVGVAWLIKNLYLDMVMKGTVSNESKVTGNYIG